MEATHEATSLHLLEQDVSLSRSIIWERQAHYFDAEGAGAFRPGAVPSYVTNHPQWARTAADLAVAFLCDAIAANAVDVTAPFYMIDAGAGSGRFAYGFVGHLAEALARKGLSHLQVVTVLADRSPQTRVFWREHPRFAADFAAGRLDIAAFDAARPTPLHLELSGVELTPGSVRNPIVVVANYLFDSLPHDVFGVSGGLVHEHLATTIGPLDDHAVAGCVTTFRAAPVALPYYGEPGLDLIVEAYRTTLEGSAFNLPIAGLRLVDELARLSRGRLCLIAADKGHRDVHELIGGSAHDLARHGSVSMMVNFDALRRWIEAQGGSAHIPRHAQPGIAYTAFSLGLATPELAHTFELEVERFGPTEYLALRQVMKRGVAGWSADELLAFWRLAAWDPSFVLFASDALLDVISSADIATRVELKQAALAAWRAYFHLHASEDPSFQLGLILAELGAFAEAIALFEHAAAVFGGTAPTFYNLAWCLVRLGQHAAAASLLDAALRLDPSHVGADRLRARIANAESWA